MNCNTPLLAPREEEVITRFVAGATPMEIAGAMGISVKTVHSHMERVRLKLDVPSTAGAVAAWKAMRAARVGAA